MFFRNIHIRIKIISLVFFCFVIAIIGKIFYTQVFEYDKLNASAISLWSRNLPIEGNRGLIYDMSGNVLVDNTTTVSLVLIPNQIKNKEETAKDLAEILGVTYEEMYSHVSKKTSIERVHPEGRKLSFEVADKINDLDIDGVYLLKEAKRNYIYGSLLAQTIGFVGIDNQGLSGLELMYDDYLTGEYGAIKYFSDAKGNKLELSEIYEQPVNGVNVTLTINLEIQEALERELDNTVSKYNPDQALGLAMNPKTGEVLAIASRPTFEPSNYSDYSIETINRNLPIWMTYEPGSTFKIITLASVLEEKLIDLENDNFFDSGGVTVSGARIRCWKAGGHGEQTYLEVVQNSCNTGFVSLGFKLGKEKLFNYIEKFGFGSKTGIDLNGEENGIIFNLDRVGDLELATTAFGQGVSVTPIQQITAVSAAINGGYLMKPYIVKSLNEPETNSVILENKPTIIRKVISEETSEKVRYALENVVANGTGRNAYIDNYRVGGKTGTAQKVKNGVYMVGNYIVSFIGFLPADDPEIIIYIAVDNPKGITQYGGTVSAPIAKSVLESAISALDIKPSLDGLEKKYNWNDKKSFKVNDVVGMEVNDAIKSLKNFKVEYSGTGKIVIYQSPAAGTKVEEGSTIKLLVSD